MSIPNKYDVAEAILKVANGNGFKPSEVRKFLQESGRFEAVSGALSAQMQQPLRELRDEGYVAFDQNYNQEKNRPHIIKSLEQLQNFVSRQEITRHEPTASAAIDSRLQEIVQMLGQLTQKVDQLSAQIQPSPENDHSESAVSEMIKLIMDRGNVRAFYQSLSSQDKDRFDRVLHFASTTAIQHGREYGEIGGYTNQPPYYNSVPLLIFARFGDAGDAVDGTRMYSIPLVCDQNRPITIIIRNTHRSRLVRPQEVSEGGNSFRPRNLDHFLDNPDHYFSYDAGQQ